MFCKCFKNGCGQMDPRQDIVLAALIASGVFPHDFGLVDVDSQDVAQPSTTQQSISISALDVGVGNEAVEFVRAEPQAPVPIVTIRHKPQPSTNTFVLNKLNQLPSLGATVTKQSFSNPIKHTTPLTKVVQVANSALRGSSTLSHTTGNPSVSRVVPSNRDQQIQLKDLHRTGHVKTTGLTGNNLMGMMKLKPPPNIATPVASATGPGEINNGIKKEVMGRDAARIWIRDDVKAHNFSHSQMDPGKDIILAALFASGFCPNDFGLVDVDSQDVAQPSTTQQSISISALDVAVGNKAVEFVRAEPQAPVPIVTIRHKPQPSTNTFVLNQLNQLPSLGATVTKQSFSNSIKHTIPLTKVVHVANSALRGSSTLSHTTGNPSVSRVVPSNRDQQIQLKDLLGTGHVKTTGPKGNNLMELMKLKPPPNIATPVASATGPGEINNGIKKEVMGRDAARIWINDDVKAHNFSHSQMDPGQDLLLAALSESGICPNDFGLFDVDSQDVAQPSTTQQSISISALDVGVGNEAVEFVRAEPQAPVPIVTIRHKPQPSTTTFVLNQLNQLPSLGATVTKQSVSNPIKHTITVTKVVHVANSALRGSSTLSHTTGNPSVSRVVPSNRDQQIQLKDLLRTGHVKTTGLKGNSLMELMKLKPPTNIATPVASATGPGEINNGIKKEVMGRDAARIWISDDVKVHNFSHSQKPPGMREEDEPEEEEEDELGHAETYAEYMPMKLRIGLRHPDPVVETSSLSSVSPPDVWYRLSIPEETIDRGCLSALQLEAVTYAAQQHETFLPNGDRAAYLIGDGAGVGKGRTIAGIIYENYLLGRKRSLWFSVSNDLKYDAERDLKDIGAKNLQVHSLNKFKYGKISSKHNGSVKKGVIFATYSSLIGESQSGGKYKTRFQQLLHWCGEDFDGVIVYDECHKAKNVCPIGSSKPTKTGLAVLELQNKLPKARVVYASATGASEPRNMAYMNRLGIWGHKTPFREFGNFIQAVERRGVGAMEIVAMDMKLRGMYIARQLSFTGVTFKIEEVPLTQKYINMYNKSVRLWVSAREKFQQAANLMEAEQRMRKSMWGQFWSAHQRFFKYLCIASKVRRVVQLAREEVQNGKCVVIGLQSTGEARTLEALEEGGGELNDFVSTAKGVLQSLVEKHFPAPDRQKLYSLLGIDLPAKKAPTPAVTAAEPEQKGKKRKGSELKKQQKKRHRTHGGLSGTSSEESQSENSDGESGKDSDDSFKSISSADEDDDFNPFRDESDDDDEDDPWLIRKEPKKGKEKKKKKRKKSIDPDSIQSALLASGLGSTRPAFTASVNIPKAPATVKAESHQDTCLTSQDAVENAQIMKKDLLEKLEELAEFLPPNTLDELIDELGGPENVAEMTGRKGRVVSNDDGSISYQSRSELDVPVEILNLTEKQRFMDGEKNIAIISEAASSGISLQADRRVKNQRRRVHMTLELPWSADRAIQQFGRTHRSNQVTAPEYVFLISELAGEQRFASIVAKRLESLGALTHGDRRATETRDLSRFNFDNKYGRSALEIVMKSIVKLDSPLVSPPSNFKGDFFKEIQVGLIGVGLINIEDRSGTLSLDKDYNNIGKFLNRILGMEVQQQNALFQYFSDTLAAVIQEAKKNGRYDMGILDLGSGDEKVKKVDCRKFLTPGYTTSGHVELFTVSVERGMAWEEATHAWADQSGADDGFYVQMRNNKKTAILVKEVNSKKRLFLVYRPNTGRQVKLETYTDIKKKFKKVLSDDAKQHWADQYKSSALICSHAYWRGNCKKASVGLQCEVGLRCRTYFVLCGSVLSVWNELEEVLTPVSGTNVKVQIVRLRTEDGQRIVGLIIPANCVSPLINKLSTSDQCQQLAVQELQKRQQLHPQSLSHAPNT